jgi:hypothetical protein
MNEYDFTLKFQLPQSQIDPNDYIDRLYESGCDDAMIGLGKKGLISLNFIRESESAYTAIHSAITDVKRAIPSALLVEATPDFVGLTDTAKILGCTRQNIRNLIIKDELKSPLPIYEGTPSIWHLAEILMWLQVEKTYEINEPLLEISRINMNLNIARNWQKIDLDSQENVKALVA